MNKDHVADLCMAFCFIVTIFGLLPLAFYLVYWSLTVDGFIDALGLGSIGFFVLVFGIAALKGLRAGRAIRQIEQQTRQQLIDGWTPAVVEEHFGRTCGQLAREGTFPSWHGEESIQSVLHRRLVRAGHIKEAS